MRCKRYMMLLLLLGCLITAKAQEQYRSWQDLYEELMTGDDAEAEQLENNMDRLEELAQHPLNINNTNREALEQLPFLSEQQLMDLQAYIARYGPMRSLGELRMIASLDYRELQLLPFFIFIGPEAERRDTLPSLRLLAENAKHELEGSLRVPFYTRKGDSNGYLGPRYKHWVRYELNSMNRLRMGIVGTQDAGEPFLSNKNKWGYDCYSYYLQLTLAGKMKKLVLGKYRLTTGMGLVMNSSFTLGKTAILQSMGRQTRTLRPHASRSETDYMQGAAATLNIARNTEATMFLSYRPIDATLNDADATAATLITSGYHRTPTEMEKKGNTHMTDAGFSLNYRHNALRLGATAVYTHLDRELKPNTSAVYRRNNAQGNDFMNVAADYSWTKPRIAINGETAINREGALSTINVISFRPMNRLALMAAQRFFSYRYTALHGHVVSEGGKVQNESSIYLGMRWHAAKYLTAEAYTDWAYFPWARYQVSKASMANDHFVALSYERRQWKLAARYRLHLRERDNSDKSALEWRTEQRTRLTATCSLPSGLSLRSQVDGALATQQGTSRGLMLSEQAGYTNNWLKATVTAAWFLTDDYDARVYLYERTLPRNFSIPAYFGRGIHLAAVAQARLQQQLTIGMRLGFTRYFDRSQTGSGYQLIDSNHTTDLDLHLHYRF